MRQIQEALYQISPNASWQIKGPAIHARESDIYQAVSIASGLRLAIKHYKTSTNQNAAQQQFNALQKYQATMTGPDDRFRVPKVYGFDQKQRLLIMEWIDGYSLHHYFWTSPKALITKVHFLKKCGQWLRAFHKNSSTKETKVNFDAYLEGIEKELSKQENSKSSPYYLHPEFGNAYKILTVIIQQAPDILDTHTTLHGDFTPHNLIINSNQTAAVDIWASTRKPVLGDLSRMLVYLTIAYPLINLKKPVFEKDGQLSNAISPLTESYGRDLVNPRSIHFKVALLSEYLRRWLVIEGRTPTALSQLTDKFQIMQIKRNIRALIASMPET